MAYLQPELWSFSLLRRGVKERGCWLTRVISRPGLLLADDALAEYYANVPTAARQLHFSVRDPGQSVDLALFVNGVPVASVELKNQMTGQNAGIDATEQCRRRDPGEPFFARRALVHFVAVSDLRDGELSEPDSDSRPEAFESLRLTPRACFAWHTCSWLLASYRGFKQSGSQP